MHDSVLPFELSRTAAMVVLAGLILALFMWNFPGSVRRLKKRIADFRKARDDYEDRHGL